MKYIISQNTLDNIVFLYLDGALNRLEKRKAKYYDGVVLAYPDKEHGILGYKNDGILYISLKLVNKISSFFGLEKSDSESVIIRWVSDRYQFEVRNINSLNNYLYYLLAIDTNLR